MAPEDIVVKTPSGLVCGERIDGVASFKRLPYAAPPTGVRRFELPSEPLGWSGVRQAKRQGPVPPQLPSRLDAVMGAYDAEQDEDCLHLDIWSSHSRDARAPVLVFIHGGGFMTGGGSLPCYDGHALAKNSGLVVVTITYRLGVLGFLPLRGLGAANLGLHDQIAALRWIRQSIAEFGGDPERITVAGQSAGAYTIAAMLGTSVGRDLFQQAILMSAPLGIALRTPEECAPIEEELLQALGLDANQTSRLRDVPVASLLQAQAALQRRPPAVPGDITPPFMPVIDGDLIPRDPLASVEQGSAAWCSTVIGTTREEFAAFLAGNPAVAALSEEQLRGAYARRHGADAGQALRIAKARRAPSSTAAVLGDLLSDSTFIEPSAVFADSQVRHGARTFAYHFDWQSPNAELGACHCIDLPFLFGNLDVWRAAPMLDGANQRELSDLSGAFQQFMTAFATHGDPNGADLPPWPERASGHAVLRFDRRISSAQCLG